jgi:acyl-CoA synthetase (AMP-forming)/AMP-acid ligase II
MSGELLRAWDRTLRRHGARTAVAQAGDGRVCTFAELDRRAAAWLAAQARPAELARRTIVFSAPNGIGWFELLLGLLRAGAVAVPLDAAEPPASQRALAEALGAGFWWDGSRLEALPGSRRIRDQGVCLVKLTSGTTGRPRPLAFTAAQLLADAGQIVATMGIRSGDLNYALIPLGHSYGLGNLALPLVAQGVPLVCGSAPLPHAIFRDFARWRPTVFPGVPALWRALASSGPEPAALESLRLAISAGAPLAPETAREFAARFGRRLHNFYGSSETGGIAFDRSGAATLAGGVGRPMRRVRIARLAGQRIRVCSPAVFTHSNRQRSGRLGRWTLPDRVEFGARGELRLVGRRGQSVKLAGRRANLAEIEARLRRLAGVRDAWIDLGPGAHAVLGAALATERPVAELRAELLADTASWKIPKKWLLLPILPLTARGKVDGRALSARLFGAA